MRTLKRKKKRASVATRKGATRKLVATFTPPAAVRAAAKDGLRLVREGYGGKGLTDEALHRARKLARGDTITLWQTRPDGSTNKSSAQFMHAWFARHKVDKRPGWKENATPGWVAWQIWGGDPAKRWVDEIMRKYA